METLNTVQDQGHISWEPRWRGLLFNPIWPLLIAALLYSVTLTNDLFGDEFDEYGFSVLGNARFGMSTTLDVHTQLARLGYMLAGEPWAIRLYSVVCALCTIVVVCRLANLLFSREKAVMAMWLTAVSPYLLEFATEARPNAIFIFAGTLFLYAVMLFLRNESWRNTLLLVFSICFGLLAREMFIAVLLCGMVYYLLQNRRITYKCLLVFACAVPLIVRQYLRMAVYSHVAPKELSEVSASLLNFLVRLPVAFTFGYCTLEYPERDVGWNISIQDVLHQNLMTVVVACIVLLGLLVGLTGLVKKNKSATTFLLCSVIIPISILLAVQKTGFSMLNEKHCAGVVGAYYVLLAAILADMLATLWGRLIIILYAFLVAASLCHFYFQPEIYSRRSNYTALNSFLLQTLESNDRLMCYHWHDENRPNYLTVLETHSYVDLWDDKPANLDLLEYIGSIEAACVGRIYLIHSQRMRGWVDRRDSAVALLRQRRDFTIRRYGRDLSLCVFAPSSDATDKLDDQSNPRRSQGGFDARR